MSNKWPILLGLEEPRSRKSMENDDFFEIECQRFSDAATCFTTMYKNSPVSEVP